MSRPLTTGGRTGAVGSATLGLATDGAQPAAKRARATQTRCRARCTIRAIGHSRFSGAVLVVEAATVVAGRGRSIVRESTAATGRSTPGAPGRCSGWITID